MRLDWYFFFFFFNDTATTEIYTLSLHDALPIWAWFAIQTSPAGRVGRCSRSSRSEEHTSELQSRRDLVCRLLLEKKKNKNDPFRIHKIKQNNTNKTTRHTNT